MKARILKSMHHHHNVWNVVTNHLGKKISLSLIQVTGFVRVLENLESPGILLWHFPGLESPGKRSLVLERSGNLFNLAKK